MFSEIVCAVLSTVKLGALEVKVSVSNGINSAAVTEMEGTELERVRVSNLTFLLGPGFGGFGGLPPLTNLDHIHLRRYTP